MAVVGEVPVTKLTILLSNASVVLGLGINLACSAKIGFANSGVFLFFSFSFLRL